MPAIKKQLNQKPTYTGLLLIRWEINRNINLVGDNIDK